MHQNWQQLAQPIQLPSDAKQTTNNHGQKNYLFRINGKPMWVPANYVKGNQVLVQPQECSECALKAASEVTQTNWNEFIVPIAAVALLAGIAFILPKLT